MRIATWNVNSLRARLEKVTWWLERARPDVLLMQETKLTDGDAPVDTFAKLGYSLAHHGEGRWNGVAIASRTSIESVVTNFGEPVLPPRTPDVDRVDETRPRREESSREVRNPLRVPGDNDDEPFSEARMIAAVIDGIRFVCVYAPNGRAVGTPFFAAKLAWFERLRVWLDKAAAPTEPLVVGGDFNVAPADIDVWDAASVHGGTHVSPQERQAHARVCQWGLSDGYRYKHSEPERYTWWDYRAGHFQKNFGMRIDHLLLSAPLVERIVWCEIDRQARKGKPIPSDHAPLVIDLDQPGHPFDAGWAGADERIAARRLARLR